MSGQSIYQNIKPLTKDEILILKCTVPMVREHVQAITNRFYSTMFMAYPVLQGIFNMSHHRAGQTEFPPQRRSFARGIMMFAQYCDNLDYIAVITEKITEKHVSLGISRDQYPIVVTYFSDAIGHVCPLMKEHEVKAWKEGIRFWGDVMMEIEAKKYAIQASAKGGWSGFRELEIVRRVEESETVCSFYLQTKDRSPINTIFKPGQFVAIRLPQERVATISNYDMTRNYTASCGPNKDYLRISIGRNVELNTKEGTYYGKVSNFMHDHMKVGEALYVSLPRGLFTYKESKGPTIFISGGIGITPLMSMLEYLEDEKKKGSPKSDGKLVSVNITRMPSTHAFKEDIHRMVKGKLLDKSIVYYTRYQGILPDLDGVEVRKGRPNVEALSELVREVTDGRGGDSSYYYCGPTGFMQCIDCILDEMHVPINRRHYEKFGPEWGGKKE